MKVAVLVCCLLALGSTVSAEEALSPFQSLFDLLHEEGLIGDEKAGQISVNINDYLDNALKIVRLWIVKNGLDPLGTDNIQKGFSMKIGFITYHGEFSLTHGWLQGLSSIMRSGDNFMKYEAQLLNLNLKLFFDSMLVNYDYSAKIMNIGPKGGVEGKIKDLQIDIDITIDTKTTEIILQNFRISNAGKITVKFSGIPIVDWLVNTLTGLATTLLHGVAEGVIQSTVRDILEKAIDDINNKMHPNTAYYLSRIELH